ncbi:MAG: hypothetical protein A2Y14_05890 [Verrucomicrobia bacterium GWF2_51_19]|nr:MAG: hypothetical protein A2Y14_05890 [Verrucomicrobia bacterium GWF2_51_19]HCJ12181.1 hypothetical protein [Opitutae bacterium]
MPSKLIAPKLEEQEPAKEHYDFMEQSSLLRECLAERQAISKLQKQESKRTGELQSLDQVIFDWILNYKPLWQAKRKDRC